jgi:hypothetical protein
MYRWGFICELPDHNGCCEIHHPQRSRCQICFQYHIREYWKRNKSWYSFLVIQNRLFTRIAIFTAKLTCLYEFYFIRLFICTDLFLDTDLDSQSMLESIILSFGRKVYIVYSVRLIKLNDSMTGFISTLLPYYMNHTNKYATSIILLTFHAPHYCVYRSERVVRLETLGGQ